jgi:hypothetical protein
MFNADKSLEVDPSVSQATGEAAVPATLADVVALVAEDAERAASQYLDETVVPHGGE